MSFWTFYGLIILWFIYRMMFGKPSPEDMREFYCPNCNNLCNVDQEYCPRCGLKLKSW